MPFSQEAGYTPSTIQTIMDSLMVNINTQFGTTYTSESFVGTNFYKYFYALAQKLQANEISTSEIFAKLQQYIAITNERISRPVVTSPGLIEKLENEGYVASVKPMVDADAGKIHICVDVDETADDYADTKLDICTIIKDSTVAGAVTQGTEVETIVLSNGQSFDFKYNLPTRIEVLLRLTITLSENNQVVVGTPDETKIKLLDNINARYRLGRNFEPQRYFSVVDAPWASKVLLEWSDDDGGSWSSDVFDAEYNELFEVLLANIELVEA
jgi:hypothetical protein